MKLFLGVDGGQSSTTALVGDQAGRVVGAGAGGPCNHAAAGEGRARLTQAVADAVGQACAHAGLAAGSVVFEAACFGMSGGPDDKRDILAGLLGAARLLVTTDAVIALAGATAGEPGIIVIAGTGSIAFGRNAEARTARAGGWGYIFGDEGGGFDLARQALRAALRMEEGWGPVTELRRVLLEATGAENVNAVMHRFYTPEWPRARVAQLARLVDTAAMEGDAVALDLLRANAQHLAELCAAVRRQLWRPGEPAYVAYIGGVFKSRVILERFRQLVELEDGCRCGPPVYPPTAGALLEAYAAAGLRPKLSQVPELKS
jgi:N-acetylglucosamine kinase-like BadF-type ATPase